VSVGIPADQQSTQRHTHKRKTPLCGARLDMAKPKTTKLSIVVGMVNIGEWRDFSP